MTIQYFVSLAHKNGKLATLYSLNEVSLQVETFPGSLPYHKLSFEPCPVDQLGCTSLLMHRTNSPISLILAHETGKLATLYSLNQGSLQVETLHGSLPYHRLSFEHCPVDQLGYKKRGEKTPLFGEAL